MINWLGSAWSQQNPHGNLQHSQWEANSSLLVSCTGAKYLFLTGTDSQLSLTFARRERTNKLLFSGAIV